MKPEEFPPWDSRSVGPNTRAEMIAKMEEYRRQISITFEVDFRPFMNAMQALADKFTAAGLAMAQKLTPAIAELARRFNAPAPFRVKRGRGQRRNRRNRRT